MSVESLSSLTAERYGMYYAHFGNEVLDGKSFCRFCGKPQDMRGDPGGAAVTVPGADGLSRLDFIVISALVGLAVLLLLLLAVI